MSWRHYLYAETQRPPLSFWGKLTQSFFPPKEDPELQALEADRAVEASTLGHPSRSHDAAGRAGEKRGRTPKARGVGEATRGLHEAKTRARQRVGQRRYTAFGTTSSLEGSAVMFLASWITTVPRLLLPSTGRVDPVPW